MEGNGSGFQRAPGGPRTWGGRAFQSTARRRAFHGPCDPPRAARLPYRGPSRCQKTQLRPAGLPTVSHSVSSPCSTFLPFVIGKACSSRISDDRCTSFYVPAPDGFYSICALDSKQLCVNRHSYHCIGTESIERIHFLLAANATGDDELPFCELAQAHRSFDGEALHEPFAIDVGVKKCAGVGF